MPRQDLDAIASEMGLRAYARVNILGKRLHLLGEGHRERYSPEPAKVLARARTSGMAVFLEQRIDGYVTKQNIGLREAMLECATPRRGRCVRVDPRQGYLPGRKGWNPSELPEYEAYRAECATFIDATRAVVEQRVDPWIREVMWRAFKPSPLGRSWNPPDHPLQRTRYRTGHYASALVNTYAASEIIRSPEKEMVFYGGAAHAVNIARLLEKAGCVIEVIRLRADVDEARLGIPALRPGAVDPT